MFCFVVFVFVFNIYQKKAFIIPAFFKHKIVKKWIMDLVILLIKWW